MENSLSMQNPHPWEISWASGDVFSNQSLLSAVYGFTGGGGGGGGGEGGGGCLPNSPNPFYTKSLQITLFF